MKDKCFTSSITVVVILAVCLLGRAVIAAESLRLNLVKAELRAIKAAEMPAKASQLVSQAKAGEVAAAAEIIIDAANSVRPAALVAVLGAIARENPTGCRRCCRQSY